MRVAYICADPGVPIFGTKGCSVHVEQIIRGFLRSGCEVDLFARSWDRPNGVPGLRTIELPSPSKSKSVSDRELRLIELDRRLALELRKNDTYELVYERQSLWSAAGMEYAFDAGIPSILEVNAPLIDEQAKYRDLVNVEKARAMLERSLNCAKSIIAVSRGVADYLRSFSPINQSKTHVVGNGVAASSFDRTFEVVRDRWLERSKLPNSRFVIGFVGTLREWHGMSALGRAYRQFHETFPDSELLVIGDGPARDELLDALGSQAAQSTTITGKLPHRDVVKMMAQFDIALAPYPDLDDFYFSPLKILEYMACGLPIVASRIGDITQLLGDGRHGLLTIPGRADGIASAMESLAQEPKLAIELGASARLAAIHQHSWDHKLDEILASVEETAISGARQVG